MVPKEEEQDQKKTEKVDWEKEDGNEIFKEVNLDQQVKNELDQEQKQKVQEYEKEKEKDKVLSFADKVRMNMAGQSVKQKAILQADEDEFVPLDITEEEYQKIKDKKNAEKKKRSAFTRNSEPAKTDGPRKFFSNTEKKAGEKKEEEDDESKKAREQKQNEQF